MKITIFILIVCLSSLEATSVSSSTQVSTEKSSVSETEKCSADDLVNGIEKLKQIQELKELKQTEELVKLSHEFQEKDYKIWQKPVRLSVIYSDLIYTLLHKLTTKIREANSGTDNMNIGADDNVKQFFNICDKNVMPFFKCIISKEIDTFKDDLSDVLDSEQSKNLTNIQKNVNSLSDNFNNDKNKFTAHGLKDELDENQKMIWEVTNSLCLKKKQAESKLTKEKISKGIKHFNAASDDITVFYGILIKTKEFSKKEVNSVYADLYPMLGCQD